MENKNIIQAINKAILEMPAIGKDSKNPQGWNFRSIDAIVDYSRKIIASNGLIIIPETLSATSKVDLIDKKGYISRLTTSSVLVKYNIYHTSGESLVAILPGESQDYADKSLSQAETFAFKSMLSKVFLLGFEEDADAKHTDTTTQKTEPKQNHETDLSFEKVWDLCKSKASIDKARAAIDYLPKSKNRQKFISDFVKHWESLKQVYADKNVLTTWDEIYLKLLETK